MKVYQTASLSSFILPPSSLLVAKRDHRVYLRRAARGDEAGEQRDRRQQQRDEGEDRGVGRGDFVEQAGEHAREREGRGQSGEDSGERERHPLSDDHADYVAAARAERDADADLVRPLRHRVRHHAEEAHAREREGDRGDQKRSG